MRRGRLWNETTQFHYDVTLHAGHVPPPSPPRTLLWGNDGLLPPDLWVLMPSGRGAFVHFGETVVTHGGLTLEEVVVPLITIQG